MVDRIAVKPYTSKNDMRLQTLFTSPYAQQQLQLANLLNYRSQVIAPEDYIHCMFQRKRQRREREVIAQEILLRAMKMDQDNRRGRRNQCGFSAQQTINASFETLDKHYRKQSYTRKKSREKSAPGYFSKAESNGEHRIRVSSAINKKSKVRTDLAESEREQNRTEPLNKLPMSSEKRRACEITMSYGLKMTTNNEKPVRHEIIVMQQNTTGENLIVYRGFLAEGESFSFQTQRRPNSPLSLAFYAKGFIDSVVNDCCEFKFGKGNPYINEHSKFLIERIEKPNPCQNCRKKRTQKSQSANTHNNNVPEDSLQNERSPKLGECFITPTLKLPIANQEVDSSERSVSTTRGQREHQKTKKYKSRGVTVSIVDEKGNKAKQNSKEQKTMRTSSECSSPQEITKPKSASVDFSLLEYTLLKERKQSKQKIPKKSTYRSILKNSSTRINTEINTQQKTSPTLSPENVNNQA